MTYSDKCMYNTLYNSLFKFVIVLRMYSMMIFQNGLEDSPRRHSSMDQLLGLINDMGKSSRTRSLSDGGTQEDEDERKYHT